MTVLLGGIVFLGALFGALMLFGSARISLGTKAPPSLDDVPFELSPPQEKPEPALAPLPAAERESDGGPSGAPFVVRSR